MPPTQPCFRLKNSCLRSLARTTVEASSSRSDCINQHRAHLWLICEVKAVSRMPLFADTDDVLDCEAGLVSASASDRLFWGFVKTPSGPPSGLDEPLTEDRSQRHAVQWLVLNIPAPCHSRLSTMRKLLHSSVGPMQLCFSLGTQERCVKISTSSSCDASSAGFVRGGSSARRVFRPGTAAIPPPTSDGDSSRFLDRFAPRLASLRPRLTLPAKHGPLRFLIHRRDLSRKCPI